MASNPDTSSAAKYDFQDISSDKIEYWVRFNPGEEYTYTPYRSGGENEGIVLMSVFYNSDDQIETNQGDTLISDYSNEWVFVQYTNID